MTRRTGAKMRLVVFCACAIVAIGAVCLLPLVAWSLPVKIAVGAWNGAWACLDIRWAALEWRRLDSMPIRPRADAPRET